MKVAIWPWPWLAVVCLLSGSARATQPQPDPADAIREGRLVTESGGARIDVPLEHTDVRIAIDGFLAEATVTQRFHNPYPTKIEAVYLFPLPTGAAVSAMRIASGDRAIDGEIQERAQATRVYEAARARGQIAALLAQERPNLFTQSVANLEPGAAIDVTLHYVQRLDYQDGGYEVVFPMVAGPRYVPGGAGHAGAGHGAGQRDAAAVQPTVLPAGVRSSHDISLAVELDAGVPIGDIASNSHRIRVARPPGAPARARVEIEPGDTIPNKDFVLRYRVAGAAPAFGALAYRGDPAAPGSFVLIAQPPAAPPPAQIAPREIVFVLDTSSSMRGAPLDKAVQLIRAVLAGLGPDDTYQIVRFDDAASALGPAPIANRPRNLALTRVWLDALDAGGATEMTTGIAAALAVPHDPLRLRIVAFLTDGYVGNEDEIIRLVGARAGDARLFAFGVGSAVNRYLLEEVAAAGRGTAQFVRPDEPTAAAVAAFERRIAAPVLTDIAIDWGGLAVSDIAPRTVPDLFARQPLAIAGRYARGGTAVVTIRGKQAGRAVRFEVPVDLPDRARTGDHPAIATVWARARIAELSRRLLRATDPADQRAIERQIIDLSIASHVLTQLTAFVAVDRSRITRGGPARRVAVPVEVPDAVAGIASGISSGYAYGSSGVAYGVAISGGASATGWGSIGPGHYGTIGAGHGSVAGYSSGTANHADSPAHPVPEVRIAAPQVAGSLDKEIIRRYLRRHLGRIRHCYELRLIARPTLAGTLATQFTIDGDGKVIAATAEGMSDAELATCVADAVRDIEFPRSTDGGNVRVNYPFAFHPGESPDRDDNTDASKQAAP